MNGFAKWNRFILWGGAVVFFTSCNVPQLNSQSISATTSSIAANTPIPPLHTPTPSPTATPTVTPTATPSTSPTATPSSISSRTVMVGYGGRRMTTLNGGDSWVLNSVDAANGGDDSTLFRGVSYANHLFVATGNRIETSPDGITWTHALTTTNWVGGAAYGNSRWIAVGGCGGRWYSTDGAAWTEMTNDYITIGGCGHLRTVVFGNGIFLALGDQNIEAITQNGTDWSVTQTLASHSSPIFVNNRFYAIDVVTGAVMQSGVVTSGTSTYTNWTPGWTAVSGLPSSGFVALTYGNGHYYATTSSKVYSSTDGSTWSNVSTGINGPIIAQGGKFLSYGWQSVSQSTNLTTWTSPTLNPSMSTNSVNAFVTIP